MQLKKAFDLAENSRAELQSIADHIPGPISKVDRHGRYVFANKIYYDWVGKTPQDIIGKMHKDILPPNVYSGAKSGIEKALSGQRVFYESHFVTVKGEKLSTAVHMIPHFTLDGQPDGFFTVVHDVTALKQAEVKLFQTSKLASLGEMSAGIAHEINNPLAIIIGSLSLLNKYKDNPMKLESKIVDIQKASIRIEKIVKGLKKFSRSSDEIVEYKSELLNDIIHEALILTEAKANRHTTSILLSLEENLSIHCDSIEIEQVFINLISNAIDAVDDRSEKWVKIITYKEQNQVVIQIIDSGDGISLEVENKLFQPFFTTKPVGKGTGLGLSITKGILDQHKASIIINRNFKNTCFEIRFSDPEGGKNVA